MKNGKTLGLFAAALTALACALPRTATAAGDVRSIEFYGNPLGEVGVVSDLSRPLVAGDKVQFRIRLANREWEKTYADNTYVNPWMLRSLAGAGSISNRMPQVGLRVSGGLRYADIVSWESPEGEAGLYHTDLICRYTVQAGDFAMPLKLANTKGTAAAMDADPSQIFETPEASNYFLTEKSLWGFFPKNPVDNVSSNQLEFYFGPETLPYPNASDFKPTEVRDYSLGNANIQIKAIDFDDTFADEAGSVWRNIAAGTTTATPAAPRLSIPGGASGSYTYYVWAKDPAIAEVEGGKDYVFGDGVTRKVAAVTVTAGNELVPFTIRAKTGQVGKTTEVYMSDTPTNIYNRAGTLIENFTTRTISVIEPPPPSITVVLDPASGIVSTSTNNYLSVATLDVELSEPWTQDVTVLLTPSMKSGSGAEPFTFIGMSTAMSGAEYYDGAIKTLTVKAGNTKASESGAMLYVYANRGNEDTAKGIRFVPSIDPASANKTAAEAFFTGEMTAATLQINANKPVITAPVEGQEYFNIPANTLTDFTISVADAMWDLHGKTAADGKYTVYIDYNGSGTYEAIPDLTANASGEITFQYRYIVGGRDYNSKVYVVNQDGISSGKENARAFTVHVNVAKKVEVTSDNAKKTYCEGETAELTFKFTEAFDYATDGFVFLEPADDNSRDLVECDAFEYGIPISVGSTEPAMSAYLTLKDGWKNCAFKYNVVVRGTDDPTDDTNIISVWGSDGITLYSTNAVPSILSVSMNNTPAYVSGETLTARAAVGVQNMFEISAWDESYDIDLEDASFETVVKFWENGAVAKTVTLNGNPYGQTIPYTFSVGGEGVKNKVTVHVYDKDMTAAERLVVDKNPFTVFVETADAPAISLSPYNNSIYFKENEAGNTTGRIYVDLTVPPTGLGTGHITVHLDVERVGADDGNYTLPVLSSYDLEFKNNITRQSFYLQELDGTPMGASKGFRIRASVVETTQSPDASKTWAEYYEPCTDFTIFIENLAPKIGPGEATTNEVPVAINVPYAISWTADDIEIDQETLEVRWTYNGSTETTIEDMRNRTAIKQITFTSSGSKTVSLMVKDKDGAFDTREYKFYVAPSKVVEIYPRGPAAGGISKFSQKYANALGLGSGRTWAIGAEAPIEIESFVQRWAFAPEELKTSVFAHGYRLGDVDDGSLAFPSGSKDFAISANGGKYTSGPYYTYTDDDEKDSFFYCWIWNQAGGDTGYEGAHLNGVVNPEIGIDANGRQEIRLPDYDDSAVTYDTTVLEAIFSKEFLPSDNVGDLNQDGIPDIYAASVEWAKGTLYAAAGYDLDGEDPGDIKNFRGFNLDEVKTTSGAEEGDFLPATSATGSSLIPNVVNWATAGGAFNAFTEIRGFDPNLNYRAENSGLNRNVRGKWISDPTFSDAEWLSIADKKHNPGIPVEVSSLEDLTDEVKTQISDWLKATSKSWIPENRTDPTVDDTDDDGFPDGYEYYFWYSAAVGKINEKGEWERLEGSRFSIKDIATGEKITSKEIEDAFNPTVQASDSFKTRDFDNDGLTDLEELAMGTNPINWDTDGDGLSDYWEIMNGMHPISAAAGEGADMNKDGDFMARWDSSKTYAVLDVEGLGLIAIPDNGADAITMEGDKATFTEEALANGVVAIKVFRYCSADKNVFVPKSRGEEVTNTVEFPGQKKYAKPLTALVWELGEDATNAMPVLVKQQVTLIHDQVRAEFGFDPRTAWYKTDNGFVSERWNTSKDRFLGDAGVATNTVAYTALDEYLLLKYRYETTPKLNGKEWSISADEARWSGRNFADVLLQGTTLPNLPFEKQTWVLDVMAEEPPKWVTDVTGEKKFVSEIHGADTDEDGVPDGWELYVGHDPNSNKEADVKDTDSDKLGLPAEYAGTDACNAYTVYRKNGDESTDANGATIGDALDPEVWAVVEEKSVMSIVKNHPGRKSGWYNKFFPTDPDNADTDGDSIGDAAEGGTWKMTFIYGNGSLGTDVSGTVQIHDYTFIYGPNEGKPAMDDGSVCIRGGGLNPCTVDTDGDCLPDPWEQRYAGVVFNTSAEPADGPKIPAGALKLIRRADGLSTTGKVECAGYYITAGMDGTFGFKHDKQTGDAYSNPLFRDPMTGTTRDFDFDHDGLENYQEYLVQSLRHLRWDDNQTPLMGQYMPSGSANSRQFFGFLPMNIMDGDAFLVAAKEAGFPAAGWDFRKLGYFARPPHEWDKVACDLWEQGYSNYDEYGYRVMLRPSVEFGSKSYMGDYCTTDPRNWDSDGDGMDDYYELFHGLNPLLGDVKGGSIQNDLIAVAYSLSVDGAPFCHWYNAWTGYPMMGMPEGLYDAMKYPWMMGTPGCDADGDGLNNYEETLYANITSPQPSHTDPTPLWMTDSSSLNKASYVSQYYLADCDNGEKNDFRGYPWGAEDAFMFSFEENEGYDTDHDGISDSEEKKMTSTVLSDPLDYADPDRRQGLYFPGENSAAVSYACAPGNLASVGFDALRQFTVEAWIRPEVVMAGHDQVIVERAVNYNENSLSNNVAKIRANFRLGIREDGYLYGMFDTSDAVETATPGSSATVLGKILAENEWVHVAMTFDGAKLCLYLDGHKVDTLPTTLVPANGITGISQRPMIDDPNDSGDRGFPTSSSYAVEPLCAIVLGARALDAKAVALTGETTWESYDSFYQGYVDEVRIWDGAQSAGNILNNYKKRLSVAEAKALREEVYTAWNEGKNRNDNDAFGLLPVELVYHYNFQTLPGAVDPADVMWEPSGFTQKVLDQVRVNGEEVPGDLYCGWWKSLPVHSTVYANYRWVPWVPNMIAHLPGLDGSTVDSMFWSERYAGMCLPTEAIANDSAKIGRFLFPNTMNPYGFFHNSQGRDSTYVWNRLVCAEKTGEAAFADVVNRRKFDNLRTSLGSTDLLPLGGAFAKRCEVMWDGRGAADAWTYTGDDLDGNGISDWWQELAIANYGAPEDFTWETMVERDGVLMTAREAYLRDLAAGLLPFQTEGTPEYVNKTDRDNDGLPDWWEDLYGLFTADGEADSDNDGLSNYAEYLIAECFSSYDFPRVKPTQERTFASDGQVVPDYFLKVGKLYLGEMFADHDLCEDAWESSYSTAVMPGSGTLFASRYVSDAWADYDDDGWSNWAECRAAKDPSTIAYLGLDKLTVNEFPVPTIQTKLVYNGDNPSASTAPVVVKAWRQGDSNSKPDAVWSIAVGSSEGSESGTEALENSRKQKMLGTNPKQQYQMYLGPGSVIPGQVRVAFKDLAMAVGSGDEQTYVESDWEELVIDRPNVSDNSKGDLLFTLDANSASKVVGSIDYVTGRALIDFSKMAEDTTIVKSEREGNIYVTHTYLMHFESCSILVKWNSMLPKQGFPMTLYLTDPEDVSSKHASRGRLREGKTIFEAFLDVDGDGEWSAGEPYGVATGVDVGWSGTAATIELTDTAPQMFRINMKAAVQANSFEAQKTLTDRGVKSSISANSNLGLPEDRVGQQMPEEDETSIRIRVTRAEMNHVATRIGSTAYVVGGVVLDVTNSLAVNPAFTERDLLKSGALDLDWGNLGTIATGMGSMLSSVTSMTYRVVVGDGSVDARIPTNLNALATMFVNTYEPGTAQSVCQPVSPKGTVYSALPTFRWTHANRIHKDYPAFRLRVWNGSTVVYDSGNRRAPARDANGVYSWTAPISVDMTTPNGVVFANTNNYTWSVSMLDAKFTTPNTTETRQEFRVEASGQIGTISDYGTLTANVRYFGPGKVSSDAKTLKGMIHVQAFTSPDFTGEPVGEARVADITDLATTEGVGCKAVIRGLPAGTYYVRAYIDSDGDYALSKWETWGYGCYVGDPNAAAIKVNRGGVVAAGDASTYCYTPKAYVVAKGAEVPNAEIFLEDMDIDNDGLPDVWEYDTQGSTDKLSSPTGDSFFTRVNPDLIAKVNAYVNFANGGLEVGGANTLASMTLWSALMKGDSATVAAAADLFSEADAPTFRDQTVVRIDAFSLEDGITIAVGSEVTGVGNELVLVSKTAKVGVYLVASTTPGFESAETVKLTDLAIEANKTTNLDVKAADVKAALKANALENALFIKVKLVEE